ncbi:hypothetical protein PCE1_002551 [Barthelona sp. PCE]
MSIEMTTPLLHSDVPGFGANTTNGKPVDGSAVFDSVLHCTKPNGFIGVQDNSPVVFSVKGDRFFYASGSHAINCFTVTGQSFALTGSLFGHQDKVHHLNPHKENKYMVSCAGDGIIVWDIEEMKSVCNIEVNSERTSDHHASDVFCSCWAFNDTVLVTGSKDNMLKFWAFDSSNGQLKFLHNLTGHKGDVLTICVPSSPTPIMASAGRDSAIRIWDIGEVDPNRRDGTIINIKTLALLEGHRGDVTRLRFTSSGTHLLSGARDNQVKFWDVHGQNELRTLASHLPGLNHHGDISYIELINSDQLLLTAGTDGLFKAWELGELPVVKINESSLQAILGETILDINEKQNVDSMIISHQLHEIDVQQACISPSAPLLLTTDSQHVLRIWDFSNFQQFKLLAEYAGHAEAVSDLTVLNDGVVASSGVDGLVNIFHHETLHRYGKIQHDASIATMSFSSPYSLLVCGGTDYNSFGYSVVEIPQFQISPFQKIFTFTGHRNNIISMDISPSEQIPLIVSGSKDFSMNVYRIPSISKTHEMIRPIQTFRHHQGIITCVCFSADGQFVATGGSDHKIVLYEVNSNLKLKKLIEIPRAHGSTISAIAFDRNYLYTGAWDNIVRVWKIGDKRPMHVLEGHESLITDISVNNEYLITSSNDGRCICRNVNGFDIIAHYDTEASCITASVIVSEDSFIYADEGHITKVPLPKKEFMAHFRKDE